MLINFMTPGAEAAAGEGLGREGHCSQGKYHHRHCHRHYDCSHGKSHLVLLFINFQVTFTTDSDCEVLLHLYKEYGPHFLKKVTILRRLLLSMVLTLTLLINIPTSARGDACFQWFSTKLFTEWTMVPWLKIKRVDHTVHHRCRCLSTACFPSSSTTPGGTSTLLPETR